MIAAPGPGVLRLASCEADGALTTWLSGEDVKTVRAELEAGRELAAHRADRHYPAEPAAAQRAEPSDA